MFKGQSLCSDFLLTYFLPVLHKIKCFTLSCLWCDAERVSYPSSHFLTHEYIRNNLVCSCVWHAFYVSFVLIFQIVDQGKNAKSYHYILANLVRKTIFIFLNFLITTNNQLYFASKKPDVLVIF